MEKYWFPVGAILNMIFFQSLLGFGYKKTCKIVANKDPE